MLKKIEILSIPFSKGMKREILEEVSGWLSGDVLGKYIVTPNPEMIIASQHDEDFKNALVSSDMSLVDGVGIVLAAAILKKRGLTRLTGVDSVDELCKFASSLSSDDGKKTVTVGFLGGRGGVAERASQCLKKKYPRLRVAYVGEEWDEKNALSAMREADSAIDILFVAFGFPKQEIWMHEHRGKIPVKIMMGVGGAFDYLSGDVKRAPKFIRQIGLEWFFRLLAQPWRIRRQLALPKFIYMVFRARFSPK